jgi:Na+-driven multidrug efflux pump
MAVESALINALLARLPDATESIAAYSIYYRLVLFALQPVIATSVAMLPFAALRAGAGEFASIRRGLDQANRAAAGYALAVVAPVLLPSAPWIAARLCDSPLAAAYATSAIRAVPLACLVGAPFLLCRPVFEALGRGRPGLFIAALRYLLLTAPLAVVGGRVATALGQPRLSGFIAGTLASAAIASTVLHLWARAALKPLARPR